MINLSLEETNLHSWCAAKQEKLMVDNSDIRILASELVKRVNDETRRSRLLEQEIDRFEADLSNLETGTANQNKEFRSKIDSIQKEMKELSDKIMVIENILGRIEKELSKKSGRSELKKMETYIDLISPINSKFVTREEMKRAIDERMGKNL